MPDEADDAAAASEMYLAASLRNAALSTRNLPPLGSCWNCSEDLMGRLNLRFCDDDCAVDWQERNVKTRRRAGMPAVGSPLVLRDEGDNEDESDVKWNAALTPAAAELRRNGK